MKSGYLFTLLLALTLNSLCALAGFPPKFGHMDIEDGLSMNTVNDMISDNQGYLWIATQSGLNRFDGNNFTIFKADNPPAGTSGDDISHLYLDDQGTLWFSTVSDGINRYNRDQQNFTHFLPAVTGLPRENISALNGDEDGNLWVATSDHGIYVFSPQSSTIVHHYLAELPSPVVTAMHKHNGVLWVATSAGVVSYSKTSGFIYHEQLQGVINSIASGGYDSLWLAGNNLLYQFILSQNEFIDHSDRMPEPLDGAEVTAVKADIYGDIWVNIRNQGLVQISADTTQLHQPNALDAGSLGSTALSTLWLDKEGQLWIGTQGEGVNRLNLAAQKWHHIRPGALRNKDITTLNTRAIFRDSSGQLWVGTSQGLYKVIEEGKIIVDMQPFSAPWIGLANSFISFIAEDNLQRLWIGTRGSGLLILDKNYSLLRHFRHDPLDPTSLPNDNLFQFFLDDQNQIWITTRGDGVIHFAADTLAFKTFRDIFGANETSDVIQDARGNIWVSSYGGGLTRMSPDGAITRFSTDTKPALPSKHLMTLAVTGHRIWAATSDGIIMFDPDSQQSRVYNTENGLINDAAYLMHRDNFNRIWVGSAAGLSLIFPETGVIRNFSVNDGIQGNEFNFGASFEESDGTLYFGGTEGYNQIMQGQTFNVNKPVAPIIESVRLMDGVHQLSSVAQPNASNSPLISLSYDANLFVLFFHSPSLSHGDTLGYEYRMQGFNDSWFKTTNNEVNFTGLAPGHYKLQLRAVSLSRDYSDITEVEVYIAPPPWQSWWAFMLYGLMALSVLGLIFYVWQQKFTVQEKLLLQLGRSEQRLQLALWSSGDEFWDWQLSDGKLTRSNTFLRYPSKESSLQETIMATVHPEDQEAVVHRMKNCLKGKSETIHVCYRGRSRETDEWIWVECRGKITEHTVDGKIQRMTGTIKNIQALKDTEGALRLLNMELEDRVDARTRELKSSQHNLQAMLEELQLTREELKDKEKMATLGGLVASITHELNTPIGVCITASSNLMERISEFNHRYKCREVSEGDFAQYQEDVEESCRLFLTNMKRISKLMNSFKHVAVDQSHEEVCQFNFHNYLMDILQSMEPMLKRTRHHYGIHCPENLWLKTNPGVFYQIVSNLFNNSIMHAFEDGVIGNMTLTVTQARDGIELCYRDDGCGMSPDVREQIFCPFFTTKRGQGGSGLGMNIVYNLVTQILEGQLQVESMPGQGTIVTILLPANLLIEQPRKEA
ncbi:two-component regulator propeller domain-containing protein [Shewanella sp. GXUN23E]|uniref:two-component regulator propeller domain-containing protein n=1 Tax=Shewanella sp. GXUN23E TaxID=3422498 RepID=UPI003D7ED8B9